MSVAIVAITVVFVKSFAKSEKNYYLIFSQFVIDIFPH